MVISALIISTLLVLGGAPVTSGDPPASLSDDPTPSELHQYLGAQKAMRLARARSLEQLAAGQPATGQTDYDVRWYDITIRVDDTTEVLYGTVTFVAEATVDNLTQVEVDFCETMSVGGIVAPSGALAYSRSGDVVTISLDDVYDIGEQFRFDFDYSGHPLEGGFQAFSFGWHDGERAISSLSEPYFARTWWPCKDRMDDKPDSIGIHIEVETSLFCASNGTLDSIRVPSSNSRVFHYTCHYPIATYLFSVAIAPYVVWEQQYVYDDGQESMPIIHHVYSDWYDYSLTRWGETPQIMEALVDAFGPYPFLAEKYGHANFGWSGGMEHQTVTSMAGSTFGFNQHVIAHEMAHQWWGDLVTCKSWRDIWLNEGWASYAEAVHELAIGDWGDYHTYMSYMAYKGGGTVWCDDTTSVWRIFNGNLSYDKAAWVVHMLRGVLGEELFAAGIEGYRTTFAYSAATTGGFRAAWEDATGVDLGMFISQWIYGQYYPRYEYYYMDEPSDAGGYDIYLIVKQTQTTYPSVFEMPVDFFFDYNSIPDDTLTLMVDEKRELFKFNQAGGVAQIKLDPSDWILKDAYDSPWELFVVTAGSELSTGETYLPYLDTIETRGDPGPDDVLVLTGQLPPGLSISDAGIISGVPTQEGLFSFEIEVVNHGSGYSDQAWFEIEILSHSCCLGQVGDANDSGDDEPTISDIMAMVDALFVSGTCAGVIDCLPEADVNQSGGSEPTCDDLTIGDITILIDYLFVTGRDSMDLPDCL